VGYDHRAVQHTRNVLFAFLIYIYICVRTRKPGQTDKIRDKIEIRETDKIREIR